LYYQDPDRLILIAAIENADFKTLLIVHVF